MVRRKRLTEMSFRPVLQEIAFVRMGTSHRVQRHIKVKMSLKSDSFHQHETLKEITVVNDEMAEPRHRERGGERRETNP